MRIMQSICNTYLFIHLFKSIYIRIYIICSNFYLGVFFRYHVGFTVFFSRWAQLQTVDLAGAARMDQIGESEVGDGDVDPREVPLEQ